MAQRPSCSPDEANVTFADGNQTCLPVGITNYDGPQIAQVSAGANVGVLVFINRSNNTENVVILPGDSHTFDTIVPQTNSSIDVR